MGSQLRNYIINCNHIAHLGNRHSQSHRLFLLRIQICQNWSVCLVCIWYEVIKIYIVYLSFWSLKVALQAIWLHILFSIWEGEHLNDCLYCTYLVQYYCQNTNNLSHYPPTATELIHRESKLKSWFHFNTQFQMSSTSTFFSSTSDLIYREEIRTWNNIYQKCKASMFVPS